MTLDVRRGADRPLSALGDRVTSRHSFSYAAHFDPDNTHFGALLAHNHDTVPPGGGFATHRHADVEIITWILAGTMAHTDSTGVMRLLSPGVVHRLSAGAGVEHSEHNRGAEPLEYVQMWLVPDAAGSRPSSAAAPIDAGDGGWVPAVAGSDEAALELQQSAATLWIARPAGAGELPVPPADQLHLYVATGEVALEGTTLSGGDAARIRDGAASGLRVGAGGAELLAWAMNPPGVLRSGRAPRDRRRPPRRR